MTCYLSESQLAVVPRPIFAGDHVRSFAGVGVVTKVLDENHVSFTLTNWRLAAYSTTQVRCTMPAAQLEVVPGPMETNVSVGQTVRCYAGYGVVQEVTSASRIKIQLTSWELAYESKVFCFVGENQVTVVDADAAYADVSAVGISLAPSPASVAAAAAVAASGLSSGDRVLSQFGAGTVVAVRDLDFVVQLDSTTWTLAYGQKPTLYLAPDMLAKETVADSKVPLGGDKCSTPFGDGFLLSSSATGQRIVESGKWKLAGDCRVRMFLEKGMVTKA